MSLHRLVIAAVFACASALPAAGEVLVQAYPGERVPAADSCRLYLASGITVIAIDDRAVADQRAAVFEVLSGKHTLQVAYRSEVRPLHGYVPPPQRFSRHSARLELDAAAGQSLQIQTADAGGGLRRPIATPYSPDSDAKAHRSMICWLDQTMGIIESWDSKSRRITLRNPVTSESRSWTLFGGRGQGYAPVYARPKSRVQELAADEKGYSVSAKVLAAGQEVHATYSSCESDVIVEIIIRD